MNDLKKLWDDGIGQWCKALQGNFYRSKLQHWIKICELPGDHEIVFWNNGNEEQNPRQIGVRVTPHDSEFISIGDLQKITASHCLETIDQDHMHDSVFSKNEVKGLFCRTEKGYRLWVGVHNEKKDYRIFEPLTPDELRNIQELEKQKEIAHKRYKELDAKHRQLLQADKFEEYDKLGSEWRKAMDEYYDVLRKIEKIRDTHQRIEEKDLDVYLKKSNDIQLVPFGGMSGYVFDFKLDLPTGPPPRINKEQRSDTMSLIPAPYSTIMQIDEAAWDNEFKTKPDAIDFYIEGSSTATTLTELRGMGTKHVRIRFPSGRVEEYDLDDLLKEEK